MINALERIPPRLLPGVSWLGLFTDQISQVLNDLSLSEDRLPPSKVEVPEKIDRFQMISLHCDDAQGLSVSQEPKFGICCHGYHILAFASARIKSKVSLSGLLSFTRLSVAKIN